MNEPIKESRRPQPKVVAGGVAGATSIVLVYLLGEAGIVLPNEVAQAMTVLITFIGSYLKRD